MQAAHRITVSVVVDPQTQQKSVHFKHQPNDGQDGTVEVKMNQEVQWACDDSSNPCSSIAVALQDPFCDGAMHISVSGVKPTATCMVNDGSMLKSEEYKITVDGVQSSDPYIIVNNQGNRDKFPLEKTKPKSGTKLPKP